MFKKIAIVNGGGDAQGLNAVLSAAVSYGSRLNYKFIGFIRGWEGVLDMDYLELDTVNTQGISQTGGTILHSANQGRFSAKKGENGTRMPIDDALLNKVIENCQKLGIYALIVVGGDGTLTGAVQLANKGLNIIAIPKTIDNDVGSTDQTFGFSTAVNIVVEALDRLHTTAASHDRVMLVETMGRHSGWLALYSGLAGSADAILLPEIDFNYQSLIKFLRWRKSVGKTYSIIVVSEGAKPIGEELVRKDIEGRESRLGGITDKIIETIDTLSPGEFELRNVVLGHLQRGGAPDAEDRILSKSYGVAAIDAIAKSNFGTMIALKNNQLVEIPIRDAVDTLKVVDPASIAFQTAKKLGIFLGI